MSSQVNPQEEDESAGSLGRERLDGTVSGVYDTLRTLARRVVQKRAGQWMLEPTELVHECYLRIAEHHQLGHLPRSEFLALAATAIRNVLVDHAREVNTVKRGGAMNRVTLDGQCLIERPTVDLIGLEEALTKLSELDERMARVVEMRFFGGLEVREVADALAVSPRVVEHDWDLARAWLHRELQKQS